MAKVVVVGAGSAGCVVAARLVEGGHEVTLLETGPEQFAPEAAARLSSVNWLDAMAVSEAFHDDVIATRLTGDAPRLYHRGRGLGGSASVNAMLALPGLPGDYQRWVDEFGLTEWSWERVQPWMDKLRSGLIVSSPEDYTPVDGALVAAASAWELPSDVDTYDPDDGGGPLWRTATSIARSSVLQTHLAPAREQGNLTIRAGVKVSRLALHEGRAVGVVLTDATQVPADEVVLCAGVFESPAILMRTEGYHREGLGKGLQDHPAASVYLALRPQFRTPAADRPCIGAVLRLSSSVGKGDIHLLPLHGTLGVTEPEHHGLVMAAVMSVTSTGRVRLDPTDPEGPPVIEERMLTTEHDQVAMREAIDAVRVALATEPFAAIVDDAFIDASGTSVTALDDQATYDRWLLSSVGDYFHAVGTARMGVKEDPGAVVDQVGRVHGLSHVRIVDASIMPTVPSANTHLPVVMLAERLAADLLVDLAMFEPTPRTSMDRPQEEHIMSTTAENAAKNTASATWERARRVVPRGVSSGHRVGWQQVFVRASGAYVWDDQGTRYVDYLNAWGPIVLGHCDRRVNEAVFEAVNTCDLTGVGPQRGEYELAEKICEVMPSAEKVAFCTSGTDATMHAVHVARAVTGRLKVLKFHGSYHGWSDHVAVGSSRKDLTAASALNTPNGGGLHPAVVADAVVVEWNDEAGLRRAFADHGDELAVAFAEGYVHSFGCVAARPGFLELLRELCTRHGVVLTFDEVKTGFRAALGGYQSICGVTPDLTAFGKAVANGYSLAGLAGSDDVMGHLGAYTKSEATIDGTYNASPYAVAAANKTLQIMESEDVFATLYARGEQMRTGIAAAIDEVGLEASVAGLGSEWCVYFRRDVPTNFREALQCDADRYAIYHAALLAHGVLEPAFPTGDRRLNAATTEEDVDRTLECVRMALEAAHA